MADIFFLNLKCPECFFSDVFCCTFADVKSAKIGCIRWKTANKLAFHSFAHKICEDRQSSATIQDAELAQLVEQLIRPKMNKGVGW